MFTMVKVLVVDDSWVARLGMSRLLVSLGHEVLEAQDGHQALEMIRNTKPSAVFLDLLMPDLDGFSVLAALREDRSSIPVFVLSADIQASTVKKCLDLGARDCLAKPPSRAVVEASLRTLE